MAPSHSKPISTGGSSYHAERLRHMKREEEVWAPPILFNDTNRSSASSKDDDDDTSEDKSRYAVFKVPFDCKNKKKDRETFEKRVLIFDEGSTEDFIEFRKSLEALIKSLGYGTDAEELNVARALLAGASLQVFDDGHAHLLKENENANDPISDSEIFERALNEVSKEVFDNLEHAYASQKRYLRSSLVMGFDQDPAKFCDRLEYINKGLRYFPREIQYNPLPFKPLPEDELISVIDKSKKPDWEVKMLEQGSTPWAFTKVADIKLFFKQLSRADKVRKKQNDLNKKRKSEESGKEEHKSKKAKSSHVHKDKKKAAKAPPKACPHCDKLHFNHDKCWTLDKNKDLRPKSWKS